MCKLRLTVLCYLFVHSIHAIGQSPDMATYQRTDSGVKISFTGLATSVDQDIYLDAVRDDIVRVTALPPDAAFPTMESLVIVDSLRRSLNALSINVLQDTLYLRTQDLVLATSLRTGSILFKDKNERIILGERKRVDGSFRPDAYNGDSFYALNQGFNVDQNEGLYGLGQHQNAVMNYNDGKQVTLLQYNTEIGVPFLLSTKNYGLLWHNYSITTAGDVRPLLPLNAFKLISKEGLAGWLTATYSHRDHPDSVWLSRPESIIDYSYLTDQHKLPKDIALAEAKVLYEGRITSPYSGLHRLHFKYAGYMRVWIDGALLEDRWRESWNAGTFEIAKEMQMGKPYDIRIEWLPDGGESYFTLNWQSPLPTDLKNTFSFASEAGDAIDYYFIYGKDMDEVISGYRDLSGKAPIMPRWSFGYWQSRERYKTQQEIEQVAQEFRKRRIPIDNMVQDWSYWAEHDWGSHEFDRARFPDPDGMIKRLHNMNMRVMISVWPKINEASSVYGQFSDKGWLYSRNIYDGRKDWIGKGYTSTFYDPFQEGARQGFWDLMNDKLYKKGIDAWWMDASEPDIHSNINLDERKAVFQPATGSSVRYYNTFPLMNAKGIYEGQRQTDPNNRVFILTRSYFAGQQRYSAAAWSGDIASRWHDMKDQIAAGVNFSMSGTPYWTMDAGGFLVEKRFHKPTQDDLEEWREMNARWYQYGAFLPMFRAHGQFPFREPFNIAGEGHPAYASMLYYIHLRYKLLTYNYSLAAKTFFDNYTMIRGLAMDFPQDQQTYAVNDQYLWGPSLLVNPVTEKGATKRTVYLPRGAAWYDLYAGKHYEGGHVIQADAPYERIPVFVRSGSILPVGKELQYTDENPQDELTLFVYDGADGVFDLYEDEGDNYNYEKGKSSIIRILYNNQDGKLTIGERKGSFDGMLEKRTFHVVFVSSQTPIGIDSEHTKKQTIFYQGKSTSITIR